MSSGTSSKAQIVCHFCPLRSEDIFLEIRNFDLLYCYSKSPLVNRLDPF